MRNKQPNPIIVRLKDLHEQHSKIVAPPLLERFCNKVSKRGKNECWEWIGAKNKQGYGFIRTKACKLGRMHMLAHRLAFIFEHGELPDWYDVCHRCDNPPCCNPYHLFAGTNLDNRLDSVNKMRVPSGEKHWKTRITERDVRDIRRMKNEGYTLSKLGEIYKMDFSSIGRICTGRSWRHVS